MTPILDYIAHDPGVQMVTIGSVGASIMVYIVRSTWLRKRRDDQTLEARRHEWAKEDRLEKYQRESMNLPSIIGKVTSE